MLLQRDGKVGAKNTGFNANGGSFNVADACGDWVGVDRVVWVAEGDWGSESNQAYTDG